MQILRVGKKAKLSKVPRWLESQLDEMTNENRLLKNEIERVELLKKKKVWLELEAQDEQVKSLVCLSDVLTEKQRQSQQHLQSFDSIGPLGRSVQ